MQPFEFRSVSRILCEAGATQKLPEWMVPLLQQNHLGQDARIFALIDPFIEKTEHFAEVYTALQKAGFQVLVSTDVEPDPPEAQVLRVAEQAKDFNADIVLAIGGGSALDIAKLVAVLAKGQQELATMYGVGNVHSQRLPLILVPTTAGTGSEVTPISIVTTGKDVKMGVVSPVLYGDLAVLDADWTLTVPQHITAATGIDAMVHAIEAYTSKRLKNAYSDMLAKQALTLLSANLKTVCAEPHNREARQRMMLGACLAGQAFANAPVGAVHALAYPIGGIFHVSHGLSNSLVLPEVLKFNAPSALPLYAELCDVLNLANAKENNETRAHAFINWCATLSPETGLPSKLREVGITEADLERLAESSMLQTRLLSNNPREVTLEDARAIYTASF